MKAFVIEIEGLFAVLHLVLTPREAGERVGYSPAHVRLLADLGKIEGKKLGHRWLIWLPSLESYAQSHN